MVCGGDMCVEVSSHVFCEQALPGRARGTMQHVVKRFRVKRIGYMAAARAGLGIRTRYAQLGIAGFRVRMMMQLESLTVGHEIRDGVAAVRRLHLLTPEEIESLGTNHRVQKQRQDHGVMDPS